MTISGHILHACTNHKVHSYNLLYTLQFTAVRGPSLFCCSFEINLRPIFLIQTIILAKQSSPTSTAIFENVWEKLGGRLSFSKLKMLIKMLISNYDLTLRSYYFCYATLLHISHKKMYIISLKFLHIRYEFLLTRLIYGRPRITT